MLKPAADWTEEYVLSLPAGENDRFERKGTKLLDLTLGRVDENAVRDELAKQLSAFANTGGGAIIYGINDEGQIDLGGVSRVLKGRQSTKDWLETVIPTLAEFEIIGVNVREIQPSCNSSQLHGDKSLFVVEIPDSDRAPHQSTRDKLYYVRLGGTSQRASHRLIEDIRSRFRHPSVVVSSAELSGWIPHLSSSVYSLQGNLEVQLDLRIKNTGKIKASDVCLAVAGYRASLSFGSVDSAIAERRTLISRGDCGFWELEHPIYPDFEADIRLTCMTAVELISYVPGKTAEWNITRGNRAVDEVGVSWTIYADSAPPTSGVITFGSRPLSKLLFEQTDRSHHRETFQRHFDPHKSYG